MTSGSGILESISMGSKAAVIPSIAVSFGFVHASAECIGADAGIDLFVELVPLLEHWPA